MKKYFKFNFLSALAVAVIALSGCSKTDDSVELVSSKSKNFQILVKGVDTKTTNSGMSTLWKKGDGINLFHAAKGTTTYVSDGKFTADVAGTSSTFTGDLGGALTEDSYNWYAFYPYSSKIVSPETTNPYYQAIGSSASGSQKQNGNNSMAHIAGTNYPLAGKVENVAKTESPVISMKHISSLLAVKVTNGTSSDITVTKVSFTSDSEPINGTFYIGFSGTEPTYTPSGTTYVSTTANLTVANGEAIKAGEYAIFYLAIKPYVEAGGNTLTLAVTAEGGEQTRTLEIPSSSDGIVFSAGKMKTLNFEYTKASNVLSLPFNDDMTWADNGTEDGDAVTSDDFPLQGTNPMYSAVNKGYKGVGGIKLGSSSERGDITTSKINLSGGNFTILVKAKTWGTDASKLQVYVDDVQVGADQTLYGEYIEYAFTRAAATSESKVKVKIDGTRGYVGSINIVSGTSVTPVICVPSVPDKLPSTGGTGTINYVVVNTEAGVVSATAAESWIHDFDYSTEGIVSFTSDANTGSERSQIITLSYSGAANKEVTVTQSASGALSISWTRSGTTDSSTEGFTFTTNAASKTGYYQDQGTAGTDVNYIQLKSATAMFTTTPTSVKLTAKLGAGSTKDPLGNNVYACLVDSEGNDIAATVTTVTTKITATTGSDFVVAIPVSGVTSAYGIKIYHLKENSWNVRYYSMTLEIQ